jgi:site-specific DNA-methyltransferase (adenine-specific)
MMTSTYNPDVLSCLANLSNDEVFTPPSLANEMLDLLPAELWVNKDAKFLDPFCKSGVFLREIAKRLISGLEIEIPDLAQRIDHIFQHQVYGIAITELTALLSRRSVYCSKKANGEFSVTSFDTDQGNIRFDGTGHSWVNGKCGFCGAGEGEYKRGETLETHAYQFIHTNKPDEIFNMKFDVIIGNPPYQLSDGGHGASAMPIYHQFVTQAKKLSPRFLTMIIPARWYVGGRALDNFRDDMLNDDRIRVLHDFPNASDCFPGVEIKGGVCYFMWDRDNRGLCQVHEHVASEIHVNTRSLLEDGMETFIRNSKAVDILKKIKRKNERSFAEVLNAGRYFGFHTKVDWLDSEKGTLQTADGQSSYPIRSQKSDAYPTKVYIAHGICYIAEKNVLRNNSDIAKFKVIIPEAGNPGSTIIGKPRISEPGSCSSNTYIVMVLQKEGIEVAQNVLSYLSTRFLRFLVALRTTTQHMAPVAYSFVPLQDFSHPWTDEELYGKYDLTGDEIAFIESMVPPMAI